jgi:hypothetical protein
VVRAAETGSAEELMRVRKEIVDLHGEMVLLENYSLLNYTGELALPAPRFLVAGFLCVIGLPHVCTFHVGLAILYDLLV